MSGDFLVALCEVVVKGVFVVVLVGELPVGEFCSHILPNTRYAGSFRLLLICVFLSHFFTLILCVIDFDVKVSYEEMLARERAENPERLKYLSKTYFVEMLCKDPVIGLNPNYVRRIINGRI